MNENEHQGPEVKNFKDALSRDMMEGGYTFLHRVFRKNIDSGKPVIIDSGGMYFQYNYSPSHNSFRDGITVLQGSNEDTEERFYSVVDSFGLELAIKEGGYVKEKDGKLKKKGLNIFQRLRINL